MKVLNTERRLCTCCMEEHDVKTVIVREKNTFKSIPVEYDAEYFYCDRADKTYANEQQISQNYVAMKDAYHAYKVLLTSYHASYDGNRITMWTICDGTFLFLAQMCVLLEKMGATNMQYTTKIVESPDHDRPWLTCKFSVSGEVQNANGVCEI